MPSGSVRGNVFLSDAGEKLIGNTYVLVHDITYKHSGYGSKKGRGILKNVGDTVDVTVTTDEEIKGKTIFRRIMIKIRDNERERLNRTGERLKKTMHNGVLAFRVNTKSYLYQLEWNDDLLSAFYENYWCDENTPEDIRRERKQGFENEKDLFRLNYVGSYFGRAQKVGKRGVYSNEDIIRKVCARSLDRNIAMLGKEYDPFKVCTPILSVDGKNIIAPIGMKEEVDEKSKFEVLEARQDVNGVTRYKRVGVVRPVKNMIWDNRYMAVEEQAEGATLMSTTFRIVSGRNFYRGMLLREIR